MNFWEAYQLMKQGVWCQACDEYAKPYRYANGRWETIQKLDCGPGVWDEARQMDFHGDDKFIVEWVPYSEYESDPIHFSMSELDARWEVADCNGVQRVEDRIYTPSKQKQERNEKERAEHEEYMRLNPPIEVNVTREALFHDRTGDLMNSIRQHVADNILQRDATMIAAASK